MSFAFTDAKGIYFFVSRMCEVLSVSQRWLLA